MIKYVRNPVITSTVIVAKTALQEDVIGFINTLLERSIIFEG